MASSDHRQKPLSPKDPVEALFLGSVLNEKVQGSHGPFVGICGVLRSKRIETVHDLVYIEPWELRDWLLSPEEEVLELLRRAWAACAAPLASAWDLARAADATARQGCATPLASLSQALGGSLRGSFLEVAGPPGTGKTQLCLHVACLTAASGGEVYWLDTERTFSPERALEMLSAILALPQTGAEQIRTLALQALTRIRHRVCSSLQELCSITAELAQSVQQARKSKLPVPGFPSLVIVDSVASVARNDGDAMADPRVAIPRRQAALSALAGSIKKLVASGSPIGVVVTNQVFGDPIAGGSKVALGHVWHHAVNWRLVLSHLPPGDARGYGTKERSVQGRRFLLVEKSPCSPPLVIRFAITAAGLEEIR